MTRDVVISCKCGKLGGIARDISARTGNRVVCYCDDCQAFAHALGAADFTLDAQGGTDIFQMSPARLELTRGRDHLACLRLTPNGALRWYADCCNTPIGNTMPTGQLPFVGLIHTCIDTEGRTLDELLGPVRACVMTRFARGVPVASGVAHNGFSLAMLVATLWKMLCWRLRGDHRDSPFFDRKSGKPVGSLRVLDEAGRA
jgi:hypothetical protein